MIRVANMLFEADVEYSGESVEVTIPRDANLTDAQIEAIKSADTLERLDVNYGEIVGVNVSYHLIEWKKVERVRGGTKFVWQTYSVSDMEELTQAVLELATIIGGNNG